MKLLLLNVIPAMAALTAISASPATAQTTSPSARPETQVFEARKPAPHNLPPSLQQPPQSTHTVLPNAVMLLTIQPDPSDPVYAAVRESYKKSFAVIKLGDTALHIGQTDKAVEDYQEALKIQPMEFTAQQRLAEAYQANEQPEQAVAAYRDLIYPKLGQNWTTSNQVSAAVLMNYCLVLLQTGQEQEALAMYNRGLLLLNYDHGRQRLKVLIPVIGPGGLPYTPQFLQAMACLGAGLDETGIDIKKFKAAVQLAPDSVAANFYLGKFLLGSPEPGGKEALEKAVRLGDSTTAEAAKELTQPHQ